MQESSFYLLKNEYVELVAALGGKYKDTKERPIYCCIQDNRVDGLYWAIPTSDISHRTPAQMSRIEMYCRLPTKDIRSCYYHIGETNRPAVFKISNVLPITEKYIAKEYMSQGSVLHIQDSVLCAALRQKLLKILSYENSFPNRLEQHITDIKSFLSKELLLGQQERTSPQKHSIHDRLSAAKAQVAERDEDKATHAPERQPKSDKER